MKRAMFASLFLGSLILCAGGQKKAVDFESGISGQAQGVCVKGPKPEWVKHIANDGAANSKSCLEISISDPAENDVPWRAGGEVILGYSLPPKTPATLHFFAKAISGSNKLKVCRGSGGWTGPGFDLSKEWKEFSVPYVSDYVTPVLIFTLADPDGTDAGIAEGTFRIDKISVTPNK